MKKLVLFLTATLLSVTAFAIDPTAGLPADVKKRHMQISNGECESETPSKTEIYDLGHGAKLYIVPCYFGAYQGSSYAYTVNKYDNINPVIVLFYDEMAKGITGTMDLTEASYDKTTKTLSTYAKGRGLGDCGQSSFSIISVDEYGYVSVKTTEIRSKMQCDQMMTEWPVTFKQ